MQKPTNSFIKPTNLKLLVVRMVHIMNLHDHEDWSVLFSVANTFSHHEEYEEAIRYWQMTFDCMPKPRYTDPYASMALCCIRLKDYKGAIGYYKKQLELLRTDWDVKYGAEVESIQEKIMQLQAMLKA